MISKQNHYSTFLVGRSLRLKEQIYSFGTFCNFSRFGYSVLCGCPRERVLYWWLNCKISLRASRCLLFWIAHAWKVHTLLCFSGSQKLLYDDSLSRVGNVMRVENEGGIRLLQKNYTLRHVQHEALQWHCLSPQLSLHRPSRSTALHWSNKFGLMMRRLTPLEFHTRIYFFAQNYLLRNCDIAENHSVGPVVAFILPTVLISCLRPFGIHTDEKGAEQMSWLY